jgi:hypothetical protein
MSNNVAEHILRATISRLQAEKDEALAILNLYLGNPVGVGDHPNIVDEVHTAVRKVADADEALGCVQRYFAASDQSDTGD